MSTLRDSTIKELKDELARRDFGGATFPDERHPVYYVFRVMSGDFDLQIDAKDLSDLSEEEVAATARLACAGWNRRRAARRCGGHHWDEPYQLDPEIWGEGEWDKMCLRCGITETAWLVQRREEYLP